MPTRSPQWWQLYGLGALMLGALIWAHRLGLADQAEMVIQLFVLVVTFGLISLWINANGPALLGEGDARAPAQDDLHRDEPAPAARTSRNGADGFAPAEPPAAGESVIAGSVLD